MIRAIFLAAVLPFLLCPLAGAQPAPGVPAAAGQHDASPAAEALRVEEILVSGNERTREEIIRRELLMRPGDPFDETRANYSRLKLLSLGYFRRVTMSLSRGTQRGWAVWRIEVEERPTLLITSGSQGFVGLSGAALGFGLGEINFRGRGQTLLGGFMLREDYAVASFGWSDPHLGGSNLVAGLRGDLFRAEQRTAGPEAGSTLVARGFSLAPFIGMGDQRFSRLVAGCRYTWAEEEYEPAGLPAAVPRPLPGDIRLASLGAAYSWSRKNDFFLPTEGTDLRVALETGLRALGGDYSYRKLTVDAEAFFPVAPRQVVGLHFFGGVIGGEAPFFERFNVATLVRGVWNFRDEWRDSALAARLEYRYQFPRGLRRFVHRWEWVLFVDAGNSWEKAHFRPGDLVWSSGLGARLDTRLGILNLVGAVWSSYDYNEW